MKQLLKKTVSVLSALAVAMGSVTALAAQTQTGSGYWWQTFDDLAAYAVPDDMYVKYEMTEGESVEMDDAGLADLAGQGVFIGGKSGMLGKADGFFAAEQLGGAAVVGAVDGAEATYLKKATGLGAQVSGSPKVHIGFELAAGDYSAERKLTLDARSKAGSGAQTMALLTVAGETGAVKAGATATDYVMPQNKWVRFDMYLTVNKDSDSTSAAVYADGKLISEAATVKHAPSSKKSYGVMSIESIKLNLVSGDSGFYMDNLTVEKVSEFPVLEEPMLEHSDPELNGRIDNDAKVINLTSSTTVDAFLDGLSRADVQVLKNDGTVQDGNVTNGVVVVGAGDEQVYYTLLTYQQSFLLNADFEDVSITDGDSLAAAAPGMTHSGTGTLSTQAGLGARDAENSALALESADGAENVLLWNGTAEGDVLTVEESVMLAGDVFAELAIHADGVTYPAAVWNADHTVLADGTDAGSWADYAWYKTVAVLDRTAGTLSVYINGELISQKPLPEELAAGINGVALNTAGSGTVGLDDAAVHTGEYVPGTDDIVLTPNNANYIVSEEDNVIYIPADTDVEGILANISVSDNAELQGVYTDAAMSVETADGAVADGNYIVFTSKIKSVYEAYKVKVSDGAQGILGVTSDRMEYDNDAGTVFAPAYTAVESFVGSIQLEDGHTGAVVDAQGRTLADDEQIGTGAKDGNRFVVTYDNGVNTFTRDYEIQTMFADADFTSLYGDNWAAGETYSGFLYGKQGHSGGTVTVTGVDDPAGSGEKVAEVYSKAGSTSGTSQQTFRYVPNDRSKSEQPFAVTWDIYPQGTTSGFNQMILKYVAQDTGAEEYYTQFEMTGGVVKFNGSNIGYYDANVWNRVIMLINPSGSEASVYLNGKRIFNGSAGRFQKKIDYVLDFIFTSSVSTSERTVYMDNLAVYPISSVKSFDASNMDTTATSTYDILDGETVSGYGPATAKQVMELFTIPEGASMAMYAADGVTPVAADAQAEEGMKMSVTSADGNFTSTYTLAEPVRFTAPEILIDGRNMSYLIPGAATATAGVYSAYPLPMKLSLTYTNGTTTNTVVSERPADHRGQFDFVTEAAGTVQNVEGEKLSLTWTDPTGEISYAEPSEIEWTGRLDLSSEIMAAKNGAISIVTITLDDGIKNTLNKCNNWFAEYGLKGTSVLPSQDVDTEAEAASYRPYYDKGYIDVASHSHTEKNLGTNPPKNEEERLLELRDSRDILREMLGQEVLTFAPSNNALDPTSQDVVGEYYWAVRQGKRGYNSISPEEGDAVGAWNNLMVQGAHNPQNRDGKACSLNVVLDEAIEEPTWLIEMYHSIEIKDQGTLPVTDSVASSHFKKMGEMQDQGLIWVATMDEATKYIRERQHTTIEDNATETSRTVTLTMDTDFLPAETFDYPLTVRSQIPAEWAEEGKYIKVNQNGRIQAPEVRNADGGLYVYYDAYPNGGPITLESTTERPEVTVTAINISSEGELTQIAGAMEPVVFTASTTPTENTDTSGIEWYVNNELQTGVVSGSLTFTFQAEKIGTYTVYAKDRLSGFQSKPITVTLREAGLLFEDDFDGYGAESILPQDNWYTTVPVNLAQYPAGSGDVAAAVGPDTTGWPGMHKTVSMAAGVPAAFTGSVALTGGKQEFQLDMRKGSDKNTAKMGLRFQKNGNIQAISPAEDGGVTAVAIAKNPIGAWVHYAFTVTPSAAGELTQIRVVLSGPELQNTSGGAEDVIVYETEVNLDGLGMAEEGSVNMVHNHNFSNSDGNDVTYLNDIRIYNPQPLKLTAVQDEYLAGDVIELKFNGEVYGFDPAGVQVKTAAGEAVPVGQAAFDSLDGRTLRLSFAEPLEKNTEYVVEVNCAGMTNVLGERAETATGTFVISGLDSITGLTVTAEGALEQKKEQLSAVTFTAATVPEANIDENRIKWYVNGTAQGVSGRSFTMTPEEIGTFAVKAVSGDVVSNEIVVTVLPPDATAIALDIRGQLLQSVDNIGEILFTAQPDPADATLDREAVVWYVNGEQKGTGETFAFTPSGLGAYEIYATLGTNEAIRSAVQTVQVQEVTYNVQTYFLDDDFEGHGPAETVISWDNGNVAPWSSALNDANKGVEVAQDPVDADNLTAKLLAYSTENKEQYPRLERNGIEVTAGKPIVVSSRLYLPTTTSKFFLQANNGGSKKEVFVFDCGNVIVNGETIEGASYPVGEWFWFSAYIVPGNDLADSTIRLTISPNATGKTVIESALNLSAIGAGTGRNFYFNVAVNPKTNDAVYVDDAKIYYPETAFLIGEKLPGIGEDTLEVSFNHDITPGTFSADSVQITANGEQIQAAEVIFDTLRPDRMTVKLAEPVAAGVAYELWLDSSVEDIAGRAVYGTLTFGDVQEPGTFTVTAAEAAGGKTTVKILRENMDDTQSIRIYTAVYAGNVLTHVEAETAAVEAGNGEQTMEYTYDYTVPENGQVKVFVWDADSTMKPLW